MHEIESTTAYYIYNEDTSIHIYFGLLARLVKTILDIERENIMVYEFKFEIYLLSTAKL